MKTLLLFLALAACGREGDTQEQAPKGDARVADLQAVMDAALDEARALRDPATRWLADDDCDGALWTGKYAAVTCDVAMDAAELAPGRFVRRPLTKGTCTSPNPDWSDWSRDMGTGLVAYAWRCKDLALLERHAAYGRAHPAIVNGLPAWRMGEPVGDGRGIYPPAFIGRVLQTQLALGGADDANRLWPDLYPKGLTDYQAHLQVMNVWHRGEVSEALRESGAGRPGVRDDAGAGQGEAFLLDVSGTQLDRLREQAARDPRDPLFQAVYGTYTGDMGPALGACLAADQYAGEYVRCATPRKCQLAAWIFACDIVLRRFKGA